MKMQEKIRNWSGKGELPTSDYYDSLAKALENLTVEADSEEKEYFNELKKMHGAPAQESVMMDEPISESELMEAESALNEALEQLSEESSTAGIDYIETPADKKKDNKNVKKKDVDEDFLFEDDDKEDDEEDKEDDEEDKEDDEDKDEGFLFESDDEEDNDDKEDDEEDKEDDEDKDEGFLFESDDEEDDLEDDKERQKDDKDARRDYDKNKVKKNREHREDDEDAKRDEDKDEDFLFEDDKATKHRKDDEDSDIDYYEDKDEDFLFEDEEEASPKDHNDKLLDLDAKIHKLQSEVDALKLKKNNDEDKENNDEENNDEDLDEDFLFEDDEEKDDEENNDEDIDEDFLFEDEEDHKERQSDLDVNAQIRKLQADLNELKAAQEKDVDDTDAEIDDEKKQESKSLKKRNANKDVAKELEEDLLFEKDLESLIGNDWDETPQRPTWKTSKIVSTDELAKQFDGYVDNAESDDWTNTPQDEKQTERLLKGENDLFEEDDEPDPNVLESEHDFISNLTLEIANLIESSEEEPEDDQQEDEEPENNQEEEPEDDQQEDEPQENEPNEEE